MISDDVLFIIRYFQFSPLDIRKSDSEIIRLMHNILPIPIKLFSDHILKLKKIKLDLPLPVIHLLVEIKRSTHMDVSIDIYWSIRCWSISTICKASPSDLFEVHDEWCVFVDHPFRNDIFSFMHNSSDPVSVCSSSKSTTRISSSWSSPSLESYDIEKLGSQSVP